MQKKTSSTYSSKKPNSEWGENRIGSFWIKEREKDSSYLLGFVKIEGKKYPISIFKNKFHEEGSTQPHFVVFKNFSQEQVQEYKNKNYTKKDL
jgi:hypothetical protein